MPALQHMRFFWHALNLLNPEMVQFISLSGRRRVANMITLLLGPAVVWAFGRAEILRLHT